MDLDEATYWEVVDNLAREAMETERTTGQDADAALLKSVASHRWVISNTRRALQVMIFCEHYDDDLVTEADLSAVWRERGLAGVASTIAFACLLGDARERLEELRRERKEVDA